MLSSLDFRLSRYSALIFCMFDWFRLGIDFSWLVHDLLLLFRHFTQHALTRIPVVEMGIFC